LYIYIIYYILYINDALCLSSTKICSQIFLMQNIELLIHHFPNKIKICHSCLNDLKYNILYIFVNYSLSVNLILTSPKVLLERSKNFPALNFIGTIDIAMINNSARAFAFGRRYQANVHTVNANFSP